MPIRIVNEDSIQLKMSAFGYTYNRKPFTGFVYKINQNFQPKKITFLLNGNRHGPEILWYQSGHKFIERHFKNGLESNSHKAWYENGQIKFFKTFQNGLAEGEFFQWHTNGQLAEWILFKNGIEKAAKSWTFNGKPFYNYIWSDNQRVGLLGDQFCSPRKK